MSFFRFVGGKGGVGKTTCAALLAVDAARSSRTLLVTTDPAPSLAAVLGSAVGIAPAPVRGLPKLHAACIDAPAAFERWLAPRRAPLAEIALRGTYLDEDDVSRLLRLSLPGIDEVIGLVEISRMAAAFDTVVVDTAPTGHTLRLLAAPALLGRAAGVLDHLQAHHRAVVSALRGSYRADAGDALILELEREGEALAGLLRDPSASDMSWVTLPEPMALEETSDALAALAAAGIQVTRLIVNRVTPRSTDSCAWCAARRRFESRALAPVARRFQMLDLAVLPDLPQEPRGPAALHAAAAAIAPWVAPPPAPALDRRVRTKAISAGARVRPSALLRDDVRWLLFGGKGGVGKTTCAAATAVDLASSSRNRRILLLSTDPAHSLGDVFGARLGDRPSRVPGGPANLHVREIDAAAAMASFRDRYVAAVDDAFASVARSAGGDRAAFRDLIDLAPPGIDEVIAVADVAATLMDANRQYDVVITDTAPTGHALRLVQTPAVLREWTLALMAILLKYREIVGAGPLASLLVQLSQQLRGLQTILADSAQARFVVVTRAAVLPGQESASLMASLRAMGIAVEAVIVNAAGAGSCRRCVAATRTQAQAIERLRAGAGCAIIEAPAEMPPPHGVPALSAWGRSWQDIT